MVMGYIWILMIGISVVASLTSGSGSALSGAVQQGAQSGVTLAISMAGSICLWSGVGRLMETAGITNLLSKLLKFQYVRQFFRFGKCRYANGHSCSKTALPLYAKRRCLRRALQAHCIEHRLHSIDPRQCGGYSGCQRLQHTL